MTPERGTLNTKNFKVTQSIGINTAISQQKRKQYTRYAHQIRSCLKSLFSNGYHALEAERNPDRMQDQESSD